MNDIIAYDNGYDSDESWEALAETGGGSLINVTRLKFTTSGDFVNKDGVAFNVDQTLIVTGSASAWIRWADGKLAETQSGVRARDELGFTDRGAWPLGMNGGPADPWQLQAYLYLLNRKTNEELTFVTSSWSGRNAIARLAKAIVGARRQYQGLRPEIKLAREPFKTKYGMRVKPAFPVVAWGYPAEPSTKPATVEEIAERAAARVEQALANTVEGRARGTMTVSSGRGNAPASFDDDIPFAPEWR